MKKIVITIQILLLAFNTALFARGIGSNTMEIMNLEPNSAGSAMAGANCALSMDLYSVHWNPANGVDVPGKQAGLNYAQWISGIKYYQLGTSWTSKKVESEAIAEIVNWNKEETLNNIDITAYYEVPDTADLFVLPSGNNDNIGIIDFQSSRVETSKNIYGKIIIDFSDYDNITSKNPIILHIKAQDKECEIIVTSPHTKDETRKSYNINTSWTEIIVPPELFFINNYNKQLIIVFNTPQKYYIKSISQEFTNIIQSNYGFNVMYLNSGDIQKTIETSQYPFYSIDGNINYTNYLLNFNYSRIFPFSKFNMPIGFALKFANEKFDDVSNMGLAFDIGAKLTKIYDEKKISFGCNVSNIKIPVLNSEPYPTLFRFGLGLQDPNLHWSLGADYNIYTDGRSHIKTGITYDISNLLYIYAGYNFTVEEQLHKGYSFGLGFNISIIKLDYIYYPLDVFSTAHRVSLILKF